MPSLVCLQETIPAFQHGNWHPSLIPLPWYIVTNPSEYRMVILRRLQSSSVAVVKDCIHAVDVHMAEDLFACPWLLLSACLKDRGQVHTCPASVLDHSILYVYVLLCLLQCYAISMHIQELCISKVCAHVALKHVCMCTGNI